MGGVHVDWPSLARLVRETEDNHLMAQKHKAFRRHCCASAGLSLALYSHT